MTPPPPMTTQVFPFMTALSALPEPDAHRAAEPGRVHSSSILRDLDVSLVREPPRRHPGRLHQVAPTGGLNNASSFARAD
jgi:hypothetical protein